MTSSRSAHLLLLKRRHMPTESPSLSITELERLLDAKKNGLANLVQRRDDLVQQIAELDRQIQGLTDLRGIFGRARKKRPVNAKPLRSLLLEVLKKNKKGFKLGDLAAKIIEAGYRSASTKFPNVVYQTIHHTPEIELDEKTGCYRLTK